jgi:hypothetical protein
MPRNGWDTLADVGKWAVVSVGAVLLYRAIHKHDMPIINNSTNIIDTAYARSPADGTGYNINISDVNGPVIISEGDVTINDNYKSNNTNSFNSGTSTGSSAGKVKSTKKNLEERTVREITEDTGSGNDRSVKDIVEGTSAENTNDRIRESPNDLIFKGYTNGNPYFYTRDGVRNIIISQMLFTGQRPIRSIELRNGSFWYMSPYGTSHRFSTMPSDMERMLINQFNSRFSTTRGRAYYYLDGIMREDIFK